MHKIDYNKTKLVAFGDSFTFGQGLFPPPTGRDKTQLSWKAESNSISYPKLIADKLKFNSVENYAVPGSSNPGMMSIMRSYYDSNPTNKDIVYLVGLTTPDRDWIMRYMDHKEKYDPVDFTYNHWLQGHNHNKNSSKTMGFDSPLYYDISQRSMEEFLTHYWNNYTILLKHAEFYFSLIDFFEARGLNYILVDVINDTLAKIDRYNLLEKVSTSGWNNIFKDAYGFELVINNYYKEAKKNKNYINSVTLQDIPYYVGTKHQNLKTPKFQNLNHYILQYGMDAYGKMASMLSTLPNDKHWNKEGHILVSNLLVEYITKNYGKK